MPLVDRVPPEFYGKHGALVDPVTAKPAAEPVAEPAPSRAEEPVAAKPEPAAATPPPAQQASAAPAQSRSIFLPLVLGGAVAGAIGFGAAMLMNPVGASDLDAVLEAQDARITALQQEIADADSVDLAPLTAAQDDLATQFASLQDDLNTLRAEIDDQLAAIAASPSGEGAATAPDTSEFEAEIDALRSQLTEMTDIARTELDSARAEAAAIEENAAAAARRAAGRAALARLQTSLETGAALGSALTDLEDVLGEAPPDALLAAQDGVPTLSALQDSFPDYARTALTTARAEGVAGEETSGIGAFLRNQFDVRSVNARDGTTADAILSRAQAAVRNGRISEALSEIAALPEIARAAMSDWIAQAELRNDAVTAIDTLAASLRDN